MALMFLDFGRFTSRIGPGLAGLRGAWGLLWALTGTARPQPGSRGRVVRPRPSRASRAAAAVGWRHVQPAGSVNARGSPELGGQWKQCPSGSAPAQRSRTAAFSTMRQGREVGRLAPR